MGYQSIEAKSILNKKKQRDSWFLDDYTLNPYSGCSFNCWYCYIRGSKYGIHMEQKMVYKANAVELLEKQLSLRSRKKQYGFIVISSATDPYVHPEESLGLTRQILEVIAAYRFPVHMITKSDLIIRDLDILTTIRDYAILPEDLKGKIDTGCLITFSFSSMDKQVCHHFEPGAPNPELRLKSLKSCCEAGFKTGISLMPLLPFISDTPKSLESMYRKGKEAGAHYLMPAGLSLFGEGEMGNRALIYNLIEKHYPHLSSAYRQLYENGYWEMKCYQNDLHKVTDILAKKFAMPQRII